MKIKVKKILLFISIILIIPSCATKQSFLKSQVNNDSNILVISGFSNEFNVKVIGTTAFTNHMTSFKSIDLDVNKVINGVINNQYESRNDVVGNQYKSRKYEIYEGEKNFDFTKGNWYTDIGFSINKYKQDFIKLGQQYNSRYIILIGAERSSDSIFFTNQWFKGFGIGRRFLMGQGRSVLFVSVKMALYDTRTNKIVNTVQTLSHKPTSKLKNGKLHKKSRQEFLILADDFPSLFKLAINGLLNKL